MILGHADTCPLRNLHICPSQHLPLLTGTNGMPTGVQLAGARGSDAKLLRTARRLCAIAG